MGQIRQYLFSIIVSAIICSMLSCLLENFKAKEPGRFICGIVLTITVIYPFTNWEKIKFKDSIASYSEEAQEVAALGKEYTYQAKADIIKLETEAYILDKASKLNAAISVSVTIADSGEPVPVSVIISGQVSPYVRNRLEKILEDDLAIAKENQQWSG